MNEDRPALSFAELQPIKCVLFSGVYSVSQPLPLQFSDIFPKRLGIFNQFFYTPIIRYYLR